jgi:hypothetical protein
MLADICIRKMLIPIPNRDRLPLLPEDIHARAKVDRVHKL